MDKHIDENEYILDNNEKKICEFYKSEYINNLNLSDKILDKELKNKSIDQWKYSSVIRYNTFKSMGLNLFMDTTNTIVAVYKIKDVAIDDREVIYNIAYINIKPPDKYKKTFFDDNILLKKSIDTSHHGNLYINNICPNGSTISKDGEYRSVLLYWKFVKYIIDKKPILHDLFNEINEYFIDKFQDRKLLIYSHYYFPTDEMRNKYSFEVELMINSKKIEFFSISWFIMYYINAFGTISDNLNQIYQKIIFKYKHEDMRFFKQLIEKYSIEVIRYLYHIFNTNIRSIKDRGINSFCKIKLGQKLIPISLREIQYQFDITYKPWKEYFVNLKLSDLVINQITSGFPITTSWLFIKNTDKHLFDNPSQYTRMEKSIQSSHITAILNQARNLTKQEVKPSNLLINDEDTSFGIQLSKKYNNVLTSWLSKEFKILYNKIDDAIIHSNSNITMSNVTFCIFTEYVGKTLYDSIFITKKSEYYKKMVTNVFSEAGYPIFEKYMFELCYNLHCSSSIIGIIHGDLHMHNIALNDLFYKSWINIDVKNPKVLYKLNDDSEFLFDTNFYNMSIIDFSRCIINISSVELFRHHVLHKHFDLIENIKEFEDLQKKQLVSYLFSAKPEYKEIGTPLITGITLNFDIYFKILSILDLYMIMTRFLDFFKFKTNLIFTPYSGCIDLIKKIHNQCDFYITNSLNSLLKNIDIEKYKSGKWPIEDIINKIFAHKNIKNIKNIDSNDIVDVYNYSNEMKYSLNKSEELPPPFKHLYNNKENDNFIKNSIERKKIYEQQVINNIKTLLIIKKRQREKNII